MANGSPGWSADVAHSLELLFDEATEATLRSEWTALAEVGLPSQAHNESPTNRPHVTLIAAERIDAASGEPLRGVAAGLPFDCRVGAPMVFGRGALTLVRLVVPSAALLRLHHTVADVSAPHVMPGPFSHTRPGWWTPHVTLCRRLSPADLPAALEVLCAGDVVGAFAGLRRWDGDARVDTLIG